MAISADLFKAVLAMDAYNRGPNAGVTVSGTQLGNAVLRTDGLPVGWSRSARIATRPEQRQEPARVVAFARAPPWR